MGNGEDTSILNRPHNYYNHPASNYGKVFATDSIGLAFAIIVVALRCYSKFHITKTPGWEDYTLILALATYIAFCSCNFVQGGRYGAGRHSWDLPPELYNGYLTNGAVAIYLWVWGSALAKVSLLLFLYRIFRVNFKFRIASWIIGFVVMVWSTVTFFLMIFSCHPIEANWNVALYLAPTTHCSPKVYDVQTVHGYCNIVTDFSILVLPIVPVWHLQMNWRKKLGLAMVFATGAFICSVSIIREYITYTTSKNTDNWDATRIAVWLSVEFCLSIVVASLPALTPLLKRASVLGSIVPSPIRSKFSRSNAQKKSYPPDIEPGATHLAPRQSHFPNTSWSAPAAWKNEQKRSFDDRASEGSEMTLQPVTLPTNRERNFKD